MRLKGKSGRLVMRSSPALHWVSGVLAAAVGAWSLLLAAGLVSDGTTYTVASRLGAGLLGGIVLACGAWLCWRAPRSTLVVDRVRQTVTLTHRGWFRTVTEQYPANAVVDARVTKERSNKRNPRYRVELVLDTGSVVPVALVGPRDRDGCMQAAGHLWTALGLPRA